MRTRGFLARSVAATGLALALAAAAPLAASAEPTAAPQPSPDCAIPSLTAVPTDLAPGTVVTVTGQNFSGCATIDGKVPTPEIPVEVGVLTAEDEMGDLLATTTTAADGSFTVQITIPALDTAEDQIAIGAVSLDDATGLSYFFALPLPYSGGSATPTAVPAGVGDLAASASDGEKGMLIGLGAAGFLLVAGGATVAVRRREHAQQH